MPRAMMPVVAGTVAGRFVKVILLFAVPTPVPASVKDVSAPCVKVAKLTPTVPMPVWFRVMVAAPTAVVRVPVLASVEFATLPV